MKPNFRTILFLHTGSVIFRINKMSCECNLEVHMLSLLLVQCIQIKALYANLYLITERLKVQLGLFYWPKPGPESTCICHCVSEFLKRM